LTNQAGNERPFGLPNEVQTGHPGVCCAVSHELRDVLGAHENGLELAAEGRCQDPVAGRAHLKASVVEQIAGILGEASLVW